MKGEDRVRWGLGISAVIFTLSFLSEEEGSDKLDMSCES
jgi:hypothetical protein